MSSLAAVLAWATIVETQHGRACAKWYVYDSVWFMALLGLLGVNIFCAAAIRFPWKRHQTGFVVTHFGLLVLLAGAFQSFLGGVDGSLSFVEGEAVRELLLAERSQITATWMARSAEAPYEFSFDAGPVDWPAGRTLNVGEVDGVRARVLAFYRHARVRHEWLRDTANLGGPAVRFRVAAKEGTTVAEPWLADRQFGEAIFVGPLKLQLERAASDRMLEDFLHPPTERVGPQGTLAIYYQDVVEHVAIDERIGQTVSLGDTGVSVEIVEYLPNAKPDRLGKFSSLGDSPKNPMVELRVRIPGQAEPLRQIAFAKDPFLNLDGVYEPVCPVKFRFFHAATRPPSSFELMQTSDGRLHGRVWMGGALSTRRDLKVGDMITLPGGFDVTLVEHLPHARQTIRFEPRANASSERERTAGEPAALVEITADGTTQEIWLQRNDLAYGQRTLTTPHGVLNVRYEHGRVPLGFTMTLVDFQREQNPGNRGNASFASRVRVTDPLRQLDEEREISMNRPLTHRRFTFYQSGFDDQATGREKSRLSVAYDPGRLTKYSGSAMICSGIAIMFLNRAFHRRRARRAGGERIASVNAKFLTPPWYGVYPN